MVQLRRDLTHLLRRDLASLEPYPAPEPLDAFARRVGLTPADVVKLDQNENPYGPSPRVRAALAAFDWYHVYPDPQPRDLHARLADYAGAPAEQIVVGNGSDELIEVLFRLFVEPGDRVVSASPTFGYYETAARIAGASYVTVPRGPDFAIDPDALVAAAEGAKIVLVASPNNPTGNLTATATIRRLLEIDALVVVDEAYFEFSGQTALDLLLAGTENLVILRTFSKWAGLAGLRLGYGIFPTALVSPVNAVKPPYSLGQAAIVAGLASLDDVDYLRDLVHRILAERERLRAGIAETGYLVPYPSDANFLLCDVRGRSAAEVQRALEAQGILVRRYSAPRLENALRISVGRPEGNDRLLTALNDIPLFSPGDRP